MKIAAFYENILDGARKSGISVPDAVKNLKKEGLELLYLSGFSYDENPGAIEDLVKAAEIGVEGLYMFYDFGENPEDTGYERLIDAAARLGGKNVLLVPGMLPKGTSYREQKLTNMVNAFKRAVAYGQQKGIDVCVEDFDGLDSPLCTVDGVDYFMKAVPGIKCAFDTGNFALHKEDEVRAFERFKGALGTVHLKDRSLTGRYPDDQCKVCADGSRVYAEVTGSGYIHMEEIMKRLKEMGYPGNVVVELYDYSPEHMLEAIAASIRWTAAHRCFQCTKASLR